VEQSNKAVCQAKNCLKSDLSMYYVSVLDRLLWWSSVWSHRKIMFNSLWESSWVRTGKNDGVFNKRLWYCSALCHDGKDT